MAKADNTGLRYNKGKPPIHLIPPEAITALAQHYQRGADKYKERNWELGMKYSHCYNSLMRHALAWWQGEDKDPETGTHHMIAVAWNAIALFIYWLRGIGTDDRVNTRPEINYKGTYKPDGMAQINKYRNGQKAVSEFNYSAPSFNKDATRYTCGCDDDTSCLHWGLHNGQ